MCLRRVRSLFHRVVVRVAVIFAPLGVVMLMHSSRSSPSCCCSHLVVLLSGSWSPPLLDPDSRRALPRRDAVRITIVLVPLVLVQRHIVGRVSVAISPFLF